MIDKKVLKYILNQGMIDFSDTNKALLDISNIISIMSKISDFEIKTTIVSNSLSLTDLREDTASKNATSYKQYFVPKVVQ